MRTYIGKDSIYKWYRDNKVTGTLEQLFKLWRKSVGEKA